MGLQSKPGAAVKIGVRISTAHCSISCGLAALTIHLPTNRRGRDYSRSRK